MAYAKTHKEESLPLIKEFMKLRDQDEVEDSYQVIIRDVQPRKPYPLKEGVETVLRNVESTIPKAKTVKPEELIDDSIMRRSGSERFYRRSLSLEAMVMMHTLIALLLVLGVAGPHGAQMQRVKIAVSSRGIAFIDLYIAEDRGFFREEGLEPELIQVAANVATAALAAGEVDALGAVGLAARASQAGCRSKSWR